ncbi:MAG: MMPL family transporter, partial [Planctomycetota bacterium]
RLTEDNRSMRRGVERLREIAVEECAVPASAIHLGGPPVDNVTIDIEGEKTLVRLAGLAGLVGVTLAYLCFRSLQLTMAVFFTAVVGAGMSLAVVFYYGAIEVFAFGLDTPRIGKADAILMSMPAVVYVLGLSGAIHLVNYYRDERTSHGLRGAAEGAVRVAWGPCVLAAFTTAVGLGSLAASDILPIRKFGVFTAAGVLIAVGLLFAMLPVLLHRFPPSDRVVQGRRREAAAGEWRWYEPLARFVTTRHGVAATLCLMVMATLAAGLPRIKTSVQLLDLLDDGCQLIADYTWLEENLGNLVPMEVIVAVDPAQMRAPDEVAVDPQAGDGTPRYRMTMYERSQMVRQLQSAVESLPPVSRALTAATFTEDPAERGGSAALRRGLEYTAATELENARGRLAEYLVPERDAQDNATGRELWRVSARVTALGGIDYGRFVEELRDQVEPILDPYRQRDALVALLAERGIDFGEANVCLLTAEADPDEPRRPVAGGAADRLLSMLESSARGDGRLQAYALDRHFALDEERRAERVATLARYDAVVAVDAAVADRLTADGVDLAVSVLGESADSGEPIPAEQARAVYTGVVPVVYKTQRELLVSLRESIGWATVLIACVMVVVLRSPAAGVASMIPNVFPIVVVFGSLGWLGIAVDIGIMMTASVALGVAVDDTLHFVTWFGRGVRAGLDRQTATRQAYERCATAMTQTTLIAGLGLAVFAVSTFTPTQQFGSLMIAMLGAALVGDLILLPALLCGPLGRFFAPKAPARPQDVPAACAEPSGGDAPGSGGEGPPDALPSGDAPGGATAAADEPTDAPDVLPFPATGGAPAEGARARRIDAAQEPLTPSNAELHERLRRLRRDAADGRR